MLTLVLTAFLAMNQVSSDGKTDFISIAANHDVIVVDMETHEMWRYRFGHDVCMGFPRVRARAVWDVVDDSVVAIYFLPLILDVRLTWPVLNDTIHYLVFNYRAPLDTLYRVEIDDSVFYTHQNYYFIGWEYMDGLPEGWHKWRVCTVTKPQCSNWQYFYYKPYRKDNE